MEASRLFLQQKVEPCIKELFRHLLPNQEFKSIHDLFNAQKFHRLLERNRQLVEYLATVNEDIQMKFYQIMDKSVRAKENSGMDQFGEGEEGEFAELKVASKIGLGEMDAHGMSGLREVENRFQELQEGLITKEEEIKALKETIKESGQELEQAKNQLLAKDQEIELMKKRMVCYIEFDNLLAQKDEQIAKLTVKLSDLTIKNRQKQSQLTSENKTLHQKLSQLESREVQILTKYQKQKQHLQLLTKQKDQSQASMKKVIGIYKDKYKSTNEKNEDYKKEIVELKFQRDKLEEELADLRSLQSDVRKPVSSSVFDNLQSPRSPLKEDLNEELGSVRGNYSKLAEQLSIDLDRADFEDEFGPLPREGNNKRFTELLQENYMLKQQLSKLQSSSSLDSKQCKDLQDQVQKMKKKINILKRRNDEIENQRKEEIDVMVGVMEQFYVGLPVGQGGGKK